MGKGREEREEREQWDKSGKFHGKTRGLWAARLGPKGKCRGDNMTGNHLTYTVRHLTEGSDRLITFIWESSEASAWDGCQGIPL